MFSAKAQSFPVLRHQQEIARSFHALPAAGCLVIHAEPGSGKTSLVPAMLASTNTGIVLVTEPRRLAAVNAAKFASTLLDVNACAEANNSSGNQTVSQIFPAQIGYVVRGERNLGSTTKVVYATEGMALVLLSDPEFVSKLSCIVVDEFHERHATTDALLLLLRMWSTQIAKIRDLQNLPNDKSGPKFVLMSATFSEDRYAQLFACQSLLKVPGLLFPVEISYRDAKEADAENSRLSMAQTHTSAGVRKQLDEFAELVCEAIDLELKNALKSSLQQTSPAFPHILVFLPGKGEIGRVKKVLEVMLSRIGAVTHAAQVSVQIDELHGELPLQKMMHSLEPVRAEDRIVKVFLATNIAESSLTLPGVRVVIDSGLMRFARHHLGSGTLELGTTKVSQNSAEQRAGRAGREGPGKVVRLFSENDFRRRALEQTPEICESDLSRNCLEILRVLASLNLPLPQSIQEWLALPWVDPPPQPRLAQALSILRGTQALDQHGRISQKGLVMGTIPLPVRLAAVVLEARKPGLETSKPHRLSKTKPQIFEILVAALCSVIAEGDVYLSQSAEHDDSLTLQLKAFLAKIAEVSRFGGFELRAANYDLRAWHRVLECLHSIYGKAFAEFCQAVRADLSLVEEWQNEQVSEELELTLGKCFFAGFFDAVAKQSDRRGLEHMNGETFTVRHDLSSAGHGSYFLVLDGLRIHSTGQATSTISKSGASQGSARKIAAKILSLPEELLFDGPEHLIEERTEVVEENNRLQVTVSLFYGKLRFESVTLSDSDARYLPALTNWVSENLLARLFEHKNLEAFLVRLRCAQGKNCSVLLDELEKQAFLLSKRCSGKKEKDSLSSGTQTAAVLRLVDFLNSSCRLSSKSIELNIDKICALESLEKWLLDYATSRELAQLAPSDLTLPNGKSLKVEYQWHASKETISSANIQFKGLGGALQVRVVGRIQDFYGVKSHPKVGSVPVELISVELLAPGGQTAQITADLGQFWKASYPEIKKAYLGRYPRHYWPDDPAGAKPFLTKRQEQGSRPL